MKYPVPKELINLADFFGKNQRERTTTAVAGLIIESAELQKVSFEHSEIGEKFQKLRGLMYKGVYIRVTQQNVESIMEPVYKSLEAMGIGDPFLLLALMTDKDVADFAAEPIKDLQAFNRTTVSEIVPYLQNIGAIDLCDADLNW